MKSTKPYQYSISTYTDNTISVQTTSGWTTSLNITSEMLEDEILKNTYLVLYCHICDNELTLKHAYSDSHPVIDKIFCSDRCYEIYQTAPTV